MIKFDFYIANKFFLTAVFSLFVFVLIFVSIDLMEKLDNFIDSNSSNETIFRYYINFIPEIIKLMTPIAMLLSSLFTTGKMSTSNELTAMKASGLSLYRFMMPILIISMLVSLFSVYFNGWIVPIANREKSTIERSIDAVTLENARSDVFMQEGPKSILSMVTFDNALKRGNNISFVKFKDSTRLSINERIDANYILYDTLNFSWTMYDCKIRNLETGEFYRLKEKNIGSLSFAPKDIVVKVDRPDEMVYDELKEYVNRQKQSGNLVTRWIVDFYGKVSFPFSSFIVVLFGVPFSFVKRQGGLALQFGLAISISFIYLGCTKVIQVVGYNGDLDPLLTAWLPNIIFLFAGIINIVRVKK
ncbi:MAG: LptF/LptG family permease [Bacteroidetes bacterium]|nr:LptF/LptG family permease [Bacteroidota bacterium]